MSPFYIQLKLYVKRRHLPNDSATVCKKETFAKRFGHLCYKQARLRSLLRRSVVNFTSIRDVSEGSGGMKSISMFFGRISPQSELLMVAVGRCSLLCVSCTSANEFSAILFFPIKLKLTSIIGRFLTNSGAKFHSNPTTDNEFPHLHLLSNPVEISPQSSPKTLK